MKKIKKEKVPIMRHIIMVNDRLAQLGAELKQIKENQAEKDEVEIRINKEDFMNYARPAAIAGTGANVGRVGDIVTAPKDREVPSALTALEQDIEILSSIIDNLISRIEPVLIPQGASPQTGAAPTGYSSSAANKLGLLTERIRMIQNQVRSANERLQL